jgi:hypothetical protein
MIGKTISHYKILKYLRSEPRFDEVLKKTNKAASRLGKYLS